MVTSVPTDPNTAAAAAWPQLTVAQQKVAAAAFDPADTDLKADKSVLTVADEPDTDLLTLATGVWDRAVGPSRTIVAACNEAIARDLATTDLAIQVDRIRAWRQSAIEFLARPPDTHDRFRAYMTLVTDLYAPRRVALAELTDHISEGRNAAAECFAQAIHAGPSRNPTTMDAWLRHHLVFIHGRGTPYHRDKAAGFNDELLRIRLVVSAWNKE